MYNHFNRPAKAIYLKYITPIRPHQNEPAAVRKIPLLKLLFFDTIFNELNYFVLEININNRKRPHRRDG